MEELNAATAGLRVFGRPVVHAYDALMQFISDEALDENERAMGEQAVAAVMWYYGLTHPLTLALIFVGGTTVRRAPKIKRKLDERRAKKTLTGGGLRAVPTPPAPPEGATP